jgi:hypothetical protein
MLSLVDINLIVILYKKYFKSTQQVKGLLWLHVWTDEHMKMWTKNLKFSYQNSSWKTLKLHDSVTGMLPTEFSCSVVWKKNLVLFIKE